MNDDVLIWYAPKWSTNPRRWWVLRKYLLSTGPIVRMAIATLFAVLAIVGSLKIAIPGIVMPNLWPIVFALPVAIGAMVLQTVVLSMFQKRIFVSEKRIVISHGQSATLISSKNLIRVRLTVHDNKKSRIRFDYFARSKHRSSTVGVSENCDLFRLSELLPIEIVTRDARRKCDVTR